MIKRKVLVVDDDKLVRWSIGQKLAEWDLASVEAADVREAVQAAQKELLDLIVLDVNLPDGKGTDLLLKFKKRWPETPVILITAFGSVDDAVMAMRRGAYDFISKPLDYVKLKSTIHNALETAALKKEVAYYKKKAREEFDPAQIIAASDVMKKIMDMTEIVAESDTIIVLLQGESGTGKDLLAQAIHHMSRHRSKAYVAINCSAIPDNLLESELFGHEKGAFTDAQQQKKGLVEMADGGTLFLDEISTLSFPLQAKLLRFLENQTFKRVGGLREIRVDLRVVAATNQDLESAVAEEKFRKDLFFRLNVCPIVIPPLRERKEDILPLAERFIRFYNVKFRKKIKGLTPPVKKIFMSYDWPGNVRELRNTVERAMIFEQNTQISPEHIPVLDRIPRLLSKRPFQKTGDLPLIPLADMERRMLIEALKVAKGNKSRAAKLLDITRDTLRYKMKKLNIHTGDK